ncbi:MAG: ABC transporter substrate-binding protein [Candidatus Moranbacteria bacterium]|nr:ABC transporter substrate-binding protein [Candidatus Moranbacteria bacterium]
MFVHTLGFKEKLLVFALTAFGVGALLFWLGAIYMSVTKPLPASGGTYTEGVVGQPSYINPLLSQTSEADADIANIIYSGLFSYDTQGQLKPNLADHYEVSEDGMTYTVTLKDNVKWHDGQTLNAEDVAFTFNIVKDPAYKSPLRQNWQGVDVVADGDKTLVFTLKKPYFGFLENLTVGILPKHIWENIAPEKFPLAEYNLSPVGSGPYQFYDFKKDSNGNILTYEVRAFPEYFDKVPYISKVIFHFYIDGDEMVDAYNRREVMGVSNVVAEQEARLQDRKSTRIAELHQPRLFAVFFNGIKSVALAHKEVRQALAYGTNRQEIIDQVLAGYGDPLSSPFLAQMKGFSSDESVDIFDKDRAASILENNGWVMKDGVREKGGSQLSFTLTTPDWPELVKTADILRKQWEDLGAKVDVRVLSVSDLQQNVLRPREYDALLFGEATSFNSDPYSFWHSSQKHDPGLNLSLFDNKDADDLLATARETLGDDERLQKYKQFRDILTEEMPAVFLYSPSYLYVVNSQVQGIDVESINMPSARLQNMPQWFIKTDRVLK